LQVLKLNLQKNVLVTSLSVTAANTIFMSVAEITVKIEPLTHGDRTLEGNSCNEREAGCSEVGVNETCHAFVTVLEFHYQPRTTPVIRKIYQLITEIW
jgi:hypothetical protein